MFTGIIEEVGIVKNTQKLTSGLSVTVFANKILEDVKIGDSIAVNGVCQTVVSFDSLSFTVELSSETLGITNFSNITKSDKVNLERALRLSDRLGGHIVSGHVDGVGDLIEISKDGNFKTLKFKAPDNIAKYIIHKGSVTINGISLTISSVEDSGRVFCVAVIPHTLENTNLNDAKIGYKVNLESDIIGKYVEKLLYKQETTAKTSLSMDFLAEHGFM